MIIDVKIVYLGDKVYAARFYHSSFGLFKSIVQAASFKDAEEKINANFKQAIWKKSISTRDSHVSFYFNRMDASDDAVIKVQEREAAQKAQEDEEKIYSLEEFDNNGKISYRAVKHDRPLMSKTEVQVAIMEKMFS